MLDGGGGIGIFRLQHCEFIVVIRRAKKTEKKILKEPQTTAPYNYTMRLQALSYMCRVFLRIFYSLMTM